MRTVDGLTASLARWMVELETPYSERLAIILSVKLNQLSSLTRPVWLAIIFHVGFFDRGADVAPTGSTV